jgi:hypothetical protein
MPAFERSASFQNQVAGILFRSFSSGRSVPAIMPLTGSRTRNSDDPIKDISESRLENQALFPALRTQARKKKRDRPVPPKKIPDVRRL